MAKHRRWDRRQPAPQRVRFIEMVHVGSLLTHLMTPDAAAEGRRSRYIALCGAEVIPASLTEPGRGHCELCVRLSVWIPIQRFGHVR